MSLKYVKTQDKLKIKKNIIVLSMNSVLKNRFLLHAFNFL